MFLRSACRNHNAANNFAQTVPGTVETVDAFAAVAGLPGVPDAATAARAAFDAMLWDRGLRAKSEELARRSPLAGAASSAGIDGIEVEWKVWKAGQAADDTPMGRAAAGIVALYAELPAMRPVWETAPLQALAKLHTLVALPVTPEDVGRPRTGEPNDPLRLGTAPEAQQVPPRLADLARRLTRPTEAPALVVAAIVHAELLTMQPFTYGSGLVARAVDRLVLSSRGLDPDNWSVPEAGLQEQTRTAYARALREYAAGEVAGWVAFHNAAMAAGTRNLAELVG